jgi:hypothetical protein
MITINDFEGDPSNYIWGDDCQLHIDSIFQKEFDGNLNLLIACCEDNATPEGVNYCEAIKQFRKEGG